jgi:hypothetical protein
MREESTHKNNYNKDRDVFNGYRHPGYEMLGVRRATIAIRNDIHSLHYV